MQNFYSTSLLFLSLLFLSSKHNIKDKIIAAKLLIHRYTVEMKFFFIGPQLGFNIEQLTNLENKNTFKIKIEQLTKLRVKIYTV
jgi:hypothetical protein